MIVDVPVMLGGELETADVEEGVGALRKCDKVRRIEAWSHG